MRRQMSIMILAIMLAVTVKADVVDDLTSPEIPTPPHQLAPQWAGPDALPRWDLLWDNGPPGPWCNHPGNPCYCEGPPEGHESQIDTYTSAFPRTLFGYGHQTSAGHRIADDFTVPEGQEWCAAEINFFAYQTGGGAPVSTITAVTLRIWNGPPGDPGSSIICGNTSQNMLISSEWSGLYRTRADQPCLRGHLNRAIMVNWVGFPEGCPSYPCLPDQLYLSPGNYWLDWDCDASLPDGPWAPPVTPDAAAADQSFNALQFIPSEGWRSAGRAVDPPQPCEFPFGIWGEYRGATSVKASTWGAIRSVYRDATR